MLQAFSVWVSDVSCIRIHIKFFNNKKTLAESAGTLNEQSL